MIFGLFRPVFGNACEELLADLARVRRVGERLFSQVRPGQVTTLGTGRPRDVELEIPEVDGGDSILRSVRIPAPVRLLAVRSGGHARVALDDGQELRVDLRDLGAYVEPHVRGTRQALRLRALRPQPLTFELGEVVRVRWQGLMSTGKVTATGISIEVDGVPHAPEQVFKMVASKPTTLIHPRGRRRMLSLDVPTGPTLDFLNQVARWTSRDDFRALPTRRKLEFLARLSIGVNAWHDSKLIEDATPNLLFESLLERGYGVCRHLNPMTAAILAETGFPVRIVHYRDHVWTEAQVTDNSGRREVWIVEASCRGANAVGVWRRRDLKRRPTRLTIPYYARADRTVDVTTSSWR